MKMMSLAEGTFVQYISGKRNCDWQIRGWKICGNRILYHGKKREQPQQGLCGGW